MKPSICNIPPLGFVNIRHRPSRANIFIQLVFDRLIDSWGLMSECAVPETPATKAFLVVGIENIILACETSIPKRIGDVSLFMKSFNLLFFYRKDAKTQSLRSLCVNLETFILTFTTLEASQLCCSR